MSLRILVRSGKDPLTPVSPESTCESNLMGNNVGNLLFSAATHKLLSGHGNVVESHGLSRFTYTDPGEINERFDVFVLPFANALRKKFEPKLLRYTKLIEKLKIPVVIAGIGAQTSIDGDLDELRPVDDSVSRFMRAVLARSGTVGVRGEFTEAYLNSLGFRDVEVIGCPSMFTNGPDLYVRKREPGLGAESRIAVNASSAGPMAKIVDRHAAKYDGIRYLCQDCRELELLLWGRGFAASNKRFKLPKSESHRLYQSDRMRICIDPWTWTQYLATFAFSFGARIHGNLAALVAGTPAFVLAHDSRTLELARYFSVPHRRMSDVSATVDAAELYEEADYAALNHGHSERFRRMEGFLRGHGIETIFSDTDGLAAFNARVAETRFPGPVKTAAGADGLDLTARMDWLRSRSERQVSALQRRVSDLERMLAGSPGAANRSVVVRRGDGTDRLS